MSNIEDNTYTILKTTFPNYVVERQYYINIEGQKLFFDFRIEVLKLLVEVQGEQHFSYSSYYHGNALGFKKSKVRDGLKRQWAKDNSYTLLEFTEKTIPTTEYELIMAIYKEKFGE